MCRRSAFSYACGAFKGQFVLSDNREGEVMYTALYRAYRPEVFDEILGQEHIVRILKNQIANGHDKPCLSVLRHARYRKDYNGKDPGKGPELFV